MTIKKDAQNQNDVNVYIMNALNSKSSVLHYEVDKLNSNKANTTDVYTSLALKANTSDVYTKTATYNLLNLKANVSDVTNSLLLKANTSDVDKSIKLLLSLLSLDQISKLEPRQIALISPEQISGLTSDQVAKLGPSQWASISPTQMAGFDASQFISISGENILNLTSEQLAALGPKQLEAMLIAKSKPIYKLIKSLDDINNFNTCVSFGGASIIGIDVKNNIKCMQIVKDKSAYIWAGITFGTKTNYTIDTIDFTYGKRFVVRYYSSRVGIPIMSKVEGPSGNEEKVVNTIVANSWQELTFTFTTNATDFNKYSIFPNFGYSGNGIDEYFWIADIKQLKT